MVSVIVALAMLDPLPAVGSYISLDRFKPTWSDEFNGSSLDPTKWQAPKMIRQGGTCEWDPSLVSVGGGNLHLRVEANPGDGPKYKCGAVRTRPDYDVSRTFFQQAYGYFEISARLFKDLNTDAWFAFWMLAGDMKDKQTDSTKGAEIDILETFTPFKNKVSGALHWGGYADTLNSAPFEFPEVPGLNKGGFHRYGLWWSPKGYAFTIDGRVAFSTDAIGLGNKNKVLSKGPCSLPGYLKLTVEAAPWSGPNVEWEPVIPKRDEALVDWIRVYQFR